MSTSRRKAASKTVDLEKSLAELETIVEQLESGALPLDTSLQEFERGYMLHDRVIRPSKVLVSKEA